MNVACQLRVIRKDRVIADHAVVRQMHISHEPVIASHTRHTRVARRTDVEGTKLSDDVSVTNDQFARFTRVFFVLRNGPQGRELENPVVLTNGGVPFDHAVRSNRRSGPDFDVGTNHRIGAY